jgi:hypothetical protein
MSEMTTAGKTLRLYDSRQEIVVALGDRVRLRNNWTGMALTWTERGVAVLLDPVSGRSSRTSTLRPWTRGTEISPSSSRMNPNRRTNRRSPPDPAALWARPGPMRIAGYPAGFFAEGAGTATRGVGAK